MGNFWDEGISCTKKSFILFNDAKQKMAIRKLFSPNLVIWSGKILTLFHKMDNSGKSDRCTFLSFSLDKDLISYFEPNHLALFFFFFTLSFSLFLLMSSVPTLKIIVLYYKNRYLPKMVNFFLMQKTLSISAIFFIIHKSCLVTCCFLAS